MGVLMSVGNGTGGGYTAKVYNTTGGYVNDQITDSPSITETGTECKIIFKRYNLDRWSLKNGDRKYTFPHLLGENYKNIFMVSVTINNNGMTKFLPALGFMNDQNSKPSIGVTPESNTALIGQNNITLVRPGGGSNYGLNDDEFSSTTIKRGFVVIGYCEF